MFFIYMYTIVLMFCSIESILLFSVIVHQLYFVIMFVFIEIVFIFTDSYLFMH